MRCRGLQRLANPAYLSDFLCCGLLHVAPYCAPGGIRTGPGIRLSLPSIPSSFRSRSPTPCLVRLTVELEEDPPVGAYRTFGNAQRLTEAPCEQHHFSE